MAFKDNVRLEQIYFANLKTLITTLKAWSEGETDAKTKDILESCIQADAAIILLYKNLGEEWNELTALVQKEHKELLDLKDELNSYRDEINDKIDEVNNYLLSLIRDLEMRMDAVEADLRSLIRNYILDLVKDGNEYHLEKDGKAVTFEDVKALYEHPHIVWIKGMVDEKYTMLVPREYDNETPTGIYEWSTCGFVNDEIHEVSVKLLPDNSVNVAISQTDFANILLRLEEVEHRMYYAETRLDIVEEDVNVLKQTAENHDARIEALETGKQDTLTPGENITIEDNVISATGGTEYTAGDGITIQDDTIYAFGDTNIPVSGEGGVSTITDADVTYTAVGAGPEVNENYYVININYPQTAPNGPGRYIFQGNVFLNSLFKDYLIGKMSDGDILNVELSTFVYNTGVRANLGHTVKGYVFKKNGKLIGFPNNTAIQQQSGPTIAQTAPISFVINEENVNFTVMEQVIISGDFLDGTITAANFDDFVSLRYKYQEIGL